MAVKIAVILLSVAVIIQTLMIDRCGKALRGVAEAIFDLRRKVKWQDERITSIKYKVDIKRERDDKERV